MKEGALFNLSRLRALFLAIEQAIGLNDPDLNHGRVGRWAADEEIRRVESRKSDRKSGRSRRLDGSQPRRPLNIGAR
jgi:hypothetical protein